MDVVGFGGTPVDSDGDGVADALDGDDDNDGIDDAIDGSPLVFGGSFSDGTSYGAILSRGGLTVHVSNEPNPAGVHISVTGSGGPATVSVCGITTLTLAAGSDLTVTCGSATMQVLEGPVSATAGTLRLTLPFGATSTVQQMGAGYSVSNSVESIGSITVNGGTLAPGNSDDDQDNDAFLSSREMFMGTNPNLACGANAWPVDINNDLKAGLSDILAYIPHFGYMPPAPQYSARFDLNADNTVGLSDILMFIPFFNLTCTP